MSCNCASVCLNEFDWFDFVSCHLDLSYVAEEVLFSALNFNVSKFSSGFCGFVLFINLEFYLEFFYSYLSPIYFNWDLHEVPTR